MIYGAQQGVIGHTADQYRAQTQAGNNAIVSPPRTIASAMGRVDGLNERLSKVREHLSNLSDQIGGPRPTGALVKDHEPPTGAVGHLNDSIDAAHDQVADIEDLLGCISRALG